MNEDKPKEESNVGGMWAAESDAGWTVADQAKKEEKEKSKTPPLVPHSAHERIPKDLEIIKKLTHHFDAMRQIKCNVLLGKYAPQGQEEPKESQAEENEEAKAPEQEREVQAPQEFTQLHEKIAAYSEKQQLDLFIYYLSMVHFHCYYSCCTFPSQEKEKVQDIFRSSERYFHDADSVDAAAWSEDLDKKIDTLLTLDLSVASGEKRNEELLETFYKDKILKDTSGPERYRCEVCAKMFKGPIYVKKHISVKHQDKLDEIRDKAREEQFFRNYVTHSDKVAATQEKEEKEREKEQGTKNSSPTRRPNNKWERNSRGDRGEKGGWGDKPDRGGFGNRQDSYNRNRSPSRDLKRQREDGDDRGRRDWGDNRRPRNFDSDRDRFGRDRGEKGGWGDKPQGWGNINSTTIGEKDKEKSGEENSGWILPEITEKDGEKDKDSEKAGEEAKGEKEKLGRGERSGGRDRWNNRDGGWRGNRDGGRGGRRPFVARWGEQQSIDFPPPPEFRDKMDPRSRPQYKDLDQPKEDSFEIDYEKALAAFADSGDS
jgi:hypothetical protein